jgi:poly(ADP-ribose) glycohydrolase
LKRTLSETFVGVPLSDDGFYSLSSGSMGNGSTGISAADYIEKHEIDGQNSCANKRNKFIINARSLSLELAKHNHRLAAQLVGFIEKFIKKCIQTHTHT